AQGLYARAMTSAVSDRLADGAADALAGGYTTIVDATFGRSEDRIRFRALAASLGVNLCIVYCHAAQNVLRRRISTRQRTRKDPSEATIEVLHWQETQFVPPARQEASLVLDAAKLSVPQLVRRIARAAARS
ncbi:MAG: ATP-binding protein, partial [Sinobacteraceae bacterium]|nr:ATP-binding protein [Nevskiaceae bacterium]MBV9316890.1 ATP-binding protein [Gammaproteobacteria bacterium]